MNQFSYTSGLYGTTVFSPTRGYHLVVHQGQRRLMSPRSPCQGDTQPLSYRPQVQTRLSHPPINWCVPRWIFLCPQWHYFPIIILRGCIAFRHIFLSFRITLPTTLGIQHPNQPQPTGRIAIATNLSMDGAQEGGAIRWPLSSTTRKLTRDRCWRINLERYPGDKRKVV